MKLPTREQLEKRRAIVLQDMAAKMDAEDFHGVADCAMDAREIDAILSVLEYAMTDGSGAQRKDAMYASEKI